MIIDCHTHPPVSTSDGVEAGRKLLGQFLIECTAVFGLPFPPAVQ